MANQRKKQLRFMPSQSSLSERDTDSENDKDSSDSSIWRYTIHSGGRYKDNFFNRPICLSPRLSELDFDNLVGFPMHYLLLVSVPSSSPHLNTHFLLGISAIE